MGNGVDITEALAFGRGEFTDERSIPSLSETATGAFEGRHTGLSVNIRKTYDANSWRVTSMVGLEAIRFERDACTETGSSANLSYLEAPSESVTLDLGVTVSKPTVQSGGTFTPHFSAGLSQQLADTPYTSSAQFAAGGPSFTTSSRSLDRTTYRLGVGFTYEADCPLDISGGLEFEGNDERTSTFGALRMTFSL